MRTLTLFISIIVSFSLYSQSTDLQGLRDSEEFPDKVEGELYFKIAPGSDVEPSSYDRDEDEASALESMPKVQELLDPYDVQRIHCPFRTEAKSIQHIYKMEFDATAEEETRELLQKLRELDYVNYAHQVQRYETFYNPNDVHPRQKWYLDSIKAGLAYDSAKGDSNTTIAIVDDAVHHTHPDLQASIKRNVDEIPGNGTDDDGNGYVDDIHGWDAANDDNNPAPPDSSALIYDLYAKAYTHGTHTSGIASGVTDNGKGIASIGFNTSIIPIRASSTGIGVGAAAKGIDYAIQANADIISMSFGGQKDSTVVNMLEQAHKDSIFLVAAAGNNGNSDTLWPAGMDEVFAVGSVGKGDTMSSFSQYGEWLDIVAPGGKIYSTLWEGDSMKSSYDTLSGTSMACPMVAGVASLMISHFDQDNPSRIESCLRKGAKNIESINPSYVDSMGAGRLNAYASLKCADPDSLAMPDTGLTVYDPDTVGNTDTVDSGILEGKQGDEAALRVHPNPSRGQVHWKAPQGFEARRVQVFGLRGKVLKEQALSSEQRGKVDLSDLPEGLYVLRFHGVDGKQAVRKVSIAR